MASTNRFLVLFLIATISFALTGCPSDTPPSDNPTPSTDENNGGDITDNGAPTEPAVTDNGDMPAEPVIEVVPPEDNTIPGEAGFDGDEFASDIPKVVLSETLEATCLVKVGDTFPSGTLVDLGETPVDLEKLLSEDGFKYTIIFFWNSSSSSSLQELEDMDQEIQPEFGPRGLLIVGINEKDSVEMIQEKLEDAGADIPILVDADGSFFDKVATEKIARTYLLDKTGKILWFDIEYSEATRRSLRHAIESLLGDESEPAAPSESSETEASGFEEF